VTACCRPVPFPPHTFDIVFSKDSIAHIADKEGLAADVFRLLRPGGWFVASDWLMGHDGEPSLAMREYLVAEGLEFGAPFVEHNIEIWTRMIDVLATGEHRPTHLRARRNEN